MVGFRQSHYILKQAERFLLKHSPAARTLQLVACLDETTRMAGTGPLPLGSCCCFCNLDHRRPLRQRNATGWDLHKLHYHRTRSSCGKTIRKSRLQSVSWSWRRGAHVRSIATPHCGRSTRDRWRTATVLILDVLDTGDSLLIAFRPFPENTASTSIQHPGWVWHNVRAVFWQLQNYDIPRIPVQLERVHTHTYTKKNGYSFKIKCFGCRSKSTRLFCDTLLEAGIYDFPSVILKNIRCQHWGRSETLRRNDRKILRCVSCSWNHLTLAVRHLRSNQNAAMCPRVDHRHPWPAPKNPTVLQAACEPVEMQTLAAQCQCM